MNKPEIRRKLSQERKPKARKILQAAHRILQTYDPITVMSLCQEIRCVAAELYQTAASIQFEENNKEQCADEPAPPTRSPNPFGDMEGREGMEGL